MKEKECPFRKEHRLCISEIGLFKALPLEIQESLIENAQHKHFEKGSILANEGDKVDGVLILRQGRIKTCRYDRDGEEYILDILHEGQAIWHDLFLNRPVYHYNIVSLTEVLVCKISRQDFMRIFSRYPQAAMSLIAMLSTELESAKERAMLLAIRSPKIRLAGFLLSKDRTCINHEIHMKLEDIAASIGLRVETVSRGIKALEQEGLIKRLGQGKLVVCDRAGLEALFNASNVIEN